MKNKFIEMSTITTSDTFTINCCGKFDSEKTHLSRAEALLLYVELHNWLTKQQDNGN